MNIARAERRVKPAGASEPAPDRHHERREGDGGAILANVAPPDPLHLPPPASLALAAACDSVPLHRILDRAVRRTTYHPGTFG